MSLRRSSAHFQFGSAMCGAAQNMNWLIVCRAVQGIGGGGIIQLVVITVSDIVPLKECVIESLSSPLSLMVIQSRSVCGVVRCYVWVCMVKSRLSQPWMSAYKQFRQRRRAASRGCEFCALCSSCRLLTRYRYQGICATCLLEMVFLHQPVYCPCSSGMHIFRTDARLQAHWRCCSSYSLQFPQS